MGLFKKLFGAGDAASDQRASDDVDQIKSGAITKIYPILKPGDWVGIKAGVVKQTLFGTLENPLLVAGFGYDAPNNFVFLMPDDLRGKDPNQVLKEAYDNLENVVSEFEPSEVLNNKVLTASGNDFSSEKILCKSHMLKAHALLQADKLLVSIPRRRCMMVVSQSADKELLSTFISLHKNAWGDDSYGNAPIIDALFVVVNGEIDSILPLNSPATGQSMDAGFEEKD